MKNLGNPNYDHFLRYGISVMENGNRVTSLHLREFPSPIYLKDLVKMSRLLVQKFNKEVK